MMQLSSWFDRFHRVGPGVLELDLPGPYRLQWGRSIAAERVGHFIDHPIPVTTGLLFAVAPYAVGAAGVAYAPLPFKPVFASMLVPTGVGEVFWFGVGYGVGTEIEEFLERH